MSFTISFIILYRANISQKQKNQPIKLQIQNIRPQMNAYYKERQKSLLVKHYHQEELKRLQKKLDQIKHRKKGIFPENNQNLPPILSPRYQMTATRMLQIKQENDRLSSKIAQTKLKESDYLRKILNEKQRIKNIHAKQKNEQESKQIKMIYSGSVLNILQGGVSGSLLKENTGRDKGLAIAQTQRARNAHKNTKSIIA